MKYDKAAAISCRNDLFLLGTVNIEDVKIDDLINLAIAAKDAYYNSDSPILSDEDYDSLERYIALASPENDVTELVGSDVRGSKVPLPVPMGGLVQAYDGEIVSWIQKYKLKDEIITITEKLDGNSVLLVYVDTKFVAAFTRGDGIEGADCTRHIKHVSRFPKVVDADIKYVRAEVIIQRNEFLTANSVAKRNYKNPRNMVAGLLNAKETPKDVLQWISIVAYEVINQNDHWPKSAQLKRLSDNGFTVPMSIQIPGHELNDAALTTLLNAWRSSSLYEIDGIVLDVNDPGVRYNINPTRDTLNPEYARKYKVADSNNSAVTTVNAIEWNVSKTGYLKPTVLISPVDLVGVTVSRATGFNAKFIFANQIGPGAKIHITRSGDVIPFITHVIESAPMNRKEYEDWFDNQLNAIGAWEWTETMVDAFLVSDHPEIAIQRTVDCFTILDVDMLRDGNVRKLFDAGINTIELIIKSTENELASIIGENGRKVFSALHEKLSSVEVPTLMAASGLFGRGIGVRKLRKLWEYSQGDRAIFHNFNEICKVEGFEAKTAQRIVLGIVPYTHFEETIRPYVTFAKYSGPRTDGELSGQVYCFTGFRSKELQQRVEELGGIVNDAFSGKVTCVVALDLDENSGKLKKAREKGIRVMSKTELENLVG